MIYALLAWLTVATITDIRFGRIFNAITYSGIVFALGVNALGSAAVYVQWSQPDRLGAFGVIGLGQALAGLAVCGLVMVACYVFFPIGGGDVKLVAMMGAFLGPEKGIMAMLWTFVLGACLALVVLVWRHGPVWLVGLALRRLLGWLRFGPFSSATPEENAALQPTLFLAPSACLAVLIVHTGWAEWLLAGR